MTTPRKHHFVPKSYLSAWTDNGSPDGLLQVIDKPSGKAWSVKPVNAAKETDLYIVDTSETDGDIAATEVETMFSTVEDLAAPEIKKMIDGQTMVSGEAREHVMAFIATLTIRVPSRLEWIDSCLRTPVEAVFQQLHAEGKLFQATDPVFAAELKQLVDTGSVSINIKQNARLAMMVSILPSLWNLLMHRHWTVLRTEPVDGDLICTDDPVLLMWTTRMHPGISPGFGLENTAVFVPIGPNTALIGHWKPTIQETTLSKQRVAFWNGELLGKAFRFVFSRGDFAALHKTGVVDSRQGVVRRWLSQPN